MQNEDIKINNTPDDDGSDIESTDTEKVSVKSEQDGSAVDGAFDGVPLIYTPMTDDELMARDITPRDTAENAEPIEFRITDDEFTARDIEHEQASIPEITDEDGDPMLIPSPVAVVIPEDDEDDKDSTEIEAKPHTDKDEHKTERERPIDAKFDFLELFVFTLVAVLVLTTFFFRHSVVDGRSMENTLYDDEHLIVSNFMYTPRRGDIIVFQDKSKAVYNPEVANALVKRVIAIGGDTVRVYRTGEVYVNGELIYEDYVFCEPDAEHLGSYFGEPKPEFIYAGGEITPEYIECYVREGELFVMGDHRDSSSDSRYFGTINEETVIGKVLLRIYPFDVFGKVE